MSFLQCPHCKSPLNPTEHKSYCCDSNHHFDLAKEGYLNLLPVNQKKSKDPGDNDLMIVARRHFLEQGFYDPVITTLKKVVSKQLDANKLSFNILDAGCGEGYYSQKTFENTQSQIIGTDISKFAIKRAAKKYKDNFYFVSSVYQLPIAPNSVDLILSIFSPIHSTEFGRVLNSNGIVVVVGPAQNHMKELAELLYDNFRPHESKITHQMGESFNILIEERKTFTIELKDTETILNLLKMTPYYYNTGKERLEKLQQCNELTVTCDFEILVFQPSKPN